MLAGFHFSALVFLFFFFSIQFSPKIKMSPHGTHHICERCRESYCYYLMLFSRKKQLFISYFFYTAQKPLFKIISHSEKGFLVFNHIVALNVAPRSINTVETPYFRHFTLSATSLSGNRTDLFVTLHISVYAYFSMFLLYSRFINLRKSL